MLSYYCSGRELVVRWRGVVTVFVVKGTVLVRVFERTVYENHPGLTIRWRGWLRWLPIRM